MKRSQIIDYIESMNTNFSSFCSLTWHDIKKTLYTLGKFAIAGLLTAIQAHLNVLIIPDITIPFFNFVVTGYMINQGINYAIVYIINRYFQDYTKLSPTS